MKTTRPAHRGIMPQALGAVAVRVSRESAKYRLPIPARARAAGTVAAAATAS